MESARWEELPPELLAAISDGLPNPIDVTRSRSVCRSWRFGIPPPPRKLSRFFPPGLPFEVKDEHSCDDYTVNATAVYLIHPQCDPCQCWIVSVQETDAGKLLLRHALTHEKISKSFGAMLDLSEYSVTQISLGYGYSIKCQTCNQIWSTRKVVFAQDSDCGLLVGLGRSRALYDAPVFGFRVGGRSQLFDNLKIDDFVNFNGRIYAVENGLQLYIFDSSDLALRSIPDEIPRHTVPVEEKSYEASLVVSDGDLYVVLKPFGWDRLVLKTWVYKVVMIGDGCRLEAVEDVGDTMFFVNRSYASFTVSALHLPPPWKGNCVVYPSEKPYCNCCCFAVNRNIGIYHIDDRYDQLFKFTYSALFYPHKQLRGYNFRSTWIEFLYDSFDDFSNRFLRK